MTTQNNQTPSDSDKLQRYVPGEQLPDLWNVFTATGEWVAHVSNNSVVVKKQDDEGTLHHDYILFGLKELNIGDAPKNVQYNTIIGKVKDEEAANALVKLGYMVEKATEEDFRQLQNELDKLLTIKAGDMDKYHRGSSS